MKAVVSHCGMGAAQEALLFGKPLLCVPILADQEVTYGCWVWTEWEGGGEGGQGIANGEVILQYYIWGN